jgi:hypothetical protein
MDYWMPRWPERNHGYYLFNKMVLVFGCLVDPKEKLW